MSSIKHYNGTSWKVDAASDARNISLENEMLLDADTTSISVERGFLKINNKISKLEHNLAWIYKNGAKGGSGSGSGSGTSVEYYITILNDQTDFYTSTSSIDIPMIIQGGSLRKIFYVTATNSSGKTLVDSETHNSLSYFNLTIKNLTEDTTIILQAHDSSDNYTSEVLIYLHVGSISLVLNSAPSKQYILGGNSNMQGSFTVLNKTGQVSELQLYNSEYADPISNGDTPISTWSVSSSNSSSIYTINFTNYMTDLTLGLKYNFKLVLYSETLNIYTNYLSLPVTVVSGTTLALLVSEIAENSTVAGDYTFGQGSYCTFKVTPSYLPSDISEFNYNYIVYNSSGELVYSYTEGTGLTKNVESIISCATTDLDLGVYSLQLTVYKDSLTATIIVYFTVGESSSGALTNFKGNMLMHYGPFNFAASTSDTTLKYTIPTNGDYFFNSYPASNSTVSTLDLVNSTSSNGFLIESNGLKYISLTGSTYAKVNRFALLFPDTSDLTNSIFSTGFYLQCTYKYNTNEPENQCILSLGTYKDGELYSGFEINSDNISLAFGSVSGISLETPIQGENYYTNSDNTTDTVTVGLKCWSAITTTASSSFNSYYFAIYIDGVMTRCTIIPESDLQSKWNFADALYLGCRSDLTNQANCKIYDLTLYTQDVPDIVPVWNWMAELEQANLTSSGTIDDTLDSVLRKKNLFTTGSNSCLLCKDDGDYDEPAAMYSKINANYSSYDLDYPVIYIQETASGNSDMYLYVKATWAAGDTDASGTKITDKKWDVAVKIKTKYGDLDISSSESDSTIGSYSPNVSIQGTSSLSYNSKNLELRMGYANSTTKKLLKINGWLPEYEYTLKADVVDSAHVNNVAVGSFVNNNTFYTISDIYPGYTTDTSDIKSKVKKTSEGFPCLVFIKYAENGEGSGATEFMGIYNFNLGRYAYNNLGMQTLASYTQDTTLSDNAPQVITEYTYNTSIADAYSLEVEDNFGDDPLLFRQADLSITEYMLSNRSPSYGDNEAFTKITDTLYTRLATAFPSGLVNRVKRNSDGTFSNIQDASGNDLYWIANDLSLNEETLETNLELDNLYAYYIIAVVFGLVDSMCKNLVLRSWDGTRWTPSFYDMDTAFKKDNRGTDSVDYDAHPNRYYNTFGTYTISGDGVTTGVEWCPESTATYDDWTFAFAGTHNNRLWEILNYLDTRSTSATRTIGTKYWEMRKNYIQDPDTFIDDYFAGYINKTGAVMYNYDYSLKYIDYSRVWDAHKGFIANTSSKQTSFLYGTRISTVRKWFKKRIQFLDSVYLSSKPTLDSSVISGINSDWNCGQNASNTITTITLSGTQRCKLQYKVSSGDTREFWIDETPTLYSVETQTNGNLWYLYGNEMIYQWDNFNSMGWSTFERAFKFPYLITLNLSNLKSVNGLVNVTPLYNYTSDVGLRNVLSINMSGFTASTTTSLDFSGCENLQELDLSNSNINSFVLPTNGALTSLNLSGSSITTIPSNQGVSILTGQSGLKTLNLSDTGITTLELSDLPLLENLTLPSNLESLTISNCNLKNLSFTWSNLSKSSPLLTLRILNCEELQSINLSGLNNLTTLELVDCPNIQSINLTNLKTPNNCVIDLSGTHGASGVLLDSLSKLTSLTLLDTTIFTTLDLTASKDLSYVNCGNCTNLTSVTCAYDETNLIELPTAAFDGCSELTTLKGYFSVEGSRVFRDCSSLDFESYIGHGLDIKLNSADLSSTFEGCSGIKSSTIILDLLHNITSNSISNMSKMFCNSGASFEISTLNMIFEADNKYYSVLDISNMFANTNIHGSIFSETDTLPGFFTYIPNVSNISYAFSGCQQELYIDNDLFKYSNVENLSNIDYLFSGSNVIAIKSCTIGSYDSTEDYLHSKNFFSSLSNKIAALHGEYIADSTNTQVRNPNWIWPFGVFYGTNIKMYVDLAIDGAPLIFTTTDSTYATSQLYLNNTLYTGIDFVIDSDSCNYSNLFKNTTKTDSDGNKYYTPKFIRITSPFSGTSNFKLQLEVGTDDSGNQLSFFDSSIVGLYNPFSGAELVDTTTIPSSLFKGCSNLKTAQGVFSGIGLNNVYSSRIEDEDNHTITKTYITGSDGNPLVFKLDGLFDDCTSLQDVSSMFSGCTEFRIELSSDLFVNCPLINVSYMFSNSRVMGTLPVRLFKNSGNTLTTMTGVFNNCYNLGYGSNFEYQELYIGGQYTNWTNRITNVESITEYGLTLPNDFFWYCSMNPTIDYVLGGMCWFNMETEESDDTYIVITGNTHGLSGKIPEDIFNGTEISKSTKLNYVFSGTYFDPYNDYIENSYTRLEQYPYIFLYTPNLKDVTGMFANTEILPTHVINPLLFTTATSSSDTSAVNLPLTTISYCWYNCLFNNYIDSEVTDTSTGLKLDSGSAQITYSMFDTYLNLTDISYSFSGRSDKETGIIWPDSTMFAFEQTGPINVAGTFANANIQTKDGTACTVPIFSGKQIKGGSSYLSGVSKDVIGNSTDVINNGLAPSNWDDA